MHEWIAFVQYCTGASFCRLVPVTVHASAHRSESAPAYDSDPAAAAGEAAALLDTGIRTVPVRTPSESQTAPAYDAQSVCRIITCTTLRVVSLNASHHDLYVICADTVMIQMHETMWKTCTARRLQGPPRAQVLKSRDQRCRLSRRDGSTAAASLSRGPQPAH